MSAPREGPGPGRGTRPPGGKAPGGLPARVVLVGFMASGKSTVGRDLAGVLHYGFVDLDREVERIAGRSIPEVFAAAGEAEFRALEARATASVDDAAPVVVAAGGGWMDRPDLRDRWPDAVRVWLRVSATEAVRRLGPELGSRPMLDPEAPVASARRLLEAREEAYARAELSVETEGKRPEEVVRRVEAALREGSGRGPV